MGLARGIFMIDGQAYIQGPKVDGKVRDKSEVLLYHMKKYDVDMCVIKSSGGYSNEFNAEMAEKYPDKFIALCNDSDLQGSSQRGEVDWTVDAAAAEIEACLKTGRYKGIGESMARDRVTKKMWTWDERLEQICQLMDLARKYKVPIAWHVGLPIGPLVPWIDLARSRAHDEVYDNGNPLLCHEVAAMYPDVPIVMSHGGIELSGYYMQDYEKCLNVAASHKNVFLETGQWWAELYSKPLKDPNIGAKKLIWGCGWGEPHRQIWMPGEVPETSNVGLLYGNSVRGVPMATDIWGWSLRELGRLNIPQDDLNLILGGNAAWVYQIPTPISHDLMFSTVDRGFERT